MSDRNLPFNQSRNQNPKIAVLNVILNFILSRGWTDYDNFSSDLTDKILESEASSEKDIIEVLQESSGSFFSLNSVDKNGFIQAFPSEKILHIIQEGISLTPLTFTDIFPEIIMTSIEDGKKLIPLLKKLPERTIQDALLDSLREKNATNPHERLRDTPLEIADLEHFILPIMGKPFSFTSVVKGYKSLPHKTVTWEDISHQITKAYQGTFPNYLLVVLAKNPADGLITNLVNYAKSVGNPNLIIMCDPVNLARFLRFRKAI